IPNVRGLLKVRKLGLPTIAEPYRGSGWPHGAYLRCHPNANADTLIEKFWTQTGDILPTLDLEKDYDNRCSLPVQNPISQKLVSWISGQKPMIYTKGACME